MLAAINRPTVGFNAYAYYFGPAYLSAAGTQGALDSGFGVKYEFW